MIFSLDYNNGYVVSVILDEGYRIFQPLRNFGLNQSDAIIFKYVDCPRLELRSIKLLIKNYNPNVKYHRISYDRFVKQSSFTP